MPRAPIPTWCFALVVVRKGDHFLLVQESKYGQPWYLPAGRVEEGESFADAAVRETLEEAGIPVRVTGIILGMVQNGHFLGNSRHPRAPWACSLRERVWGTVPQRC